MTQPSDINKILEDTYSNKKVLDDFGFTQEYSLSSKDVLDIIIQLISDNKIRVV